MQGVMSKNRRLRILGAAIVGRDKIVHHINTVALEVLGKTRVGVVGNICKRIMCPAWDGRCQVHHLATVKETDA
jgi:hypothetical protein